MRRKGGEGRQEGWERRTESLVDPKEELESSGKVGDDSKRVLDTYESNDCYRAVSGRLPDSVAACRPPDAVDPPLSEVRPSVMVSGKGTCQRDQRQSTRCSTSVLGRS